MNVLFKNFKKLVEPMQLWLLSQGRCVGCGKELSLVVDRKKKGSEEQVGCECRRIYMFDPKKKTYRRALLAELS